ncbi:MAG: ATP synthase F1 subunit gamma [Nitrospina sp.]|jgi:F-type H+-transporting ATPase subunit gamma|nr:ATP synthase F1 subunit gamma [Nitrospina sp.]MBT3876245.1 ATP synthase F1 subunit gamma [Nitrospina sp.]MBT4047990.1 ATP synthase F1 subunit gamma [Nitrospina sp.]MBT4555949.1 ATP synthase F1 subunit gamma [Nitrospina sp.]MBT5348020.1 ATP synthase F1 subunit gamma [Nitrospina sp.]
MPNLKEIKRRIQSVKNTQQITKAMKLVAASKLRKAQLAILEARPYAIKMMDVLNHLAARCNGDLHPLLDVREGNRHLLLIITSDKGLCGGFNGSVIRKTAKYLKENPENENSLIIAGKKGNDIFRNRPVTITDDIIGWSKDFDYLKAQSIGENLAKMFSEKKIDKVFMVYNEFKSVMQQEVVVEQLLPVLPEKLAHKEDTFVVDYIYEPDEEAILDQLLKRYMTVEVYRAFLESTASEHGARMTAMDSASRNAGKMIGELTLTYNQARQAYITKELIEIVNGAEALKG